MWNSPVVFPLNDTCSSTTRLYLLYVFLYRTKFEAKYGYCVGSEVPVALSRLRSTYNPNMWFLRLCSTCTRVRYFVLVPVVLDSSLIICHDLISNFWNSNDFGSLLQVEILVLLYSLTFIVAYQKSTLNSLVLVCILWSKGRSIFEIPVVEGKFLVLLLLFKLL
jgi:hypothetical protein